MATKSWLDEIEWLEDEEEKSTSLPKPASWLNEIDWEDKEDKVAELETLSQKPSWLNGVEWLEEEPTKPVARRPLVSPRAPTLESMGVTAIEETMPEESFLRPLADPLLNIGAGINDVVKGFSDAFGADNAVSQNLAKNSEWYRSLLSAGAKQDQEEIGRIMQEAEGQGVLAEIGAGLKALSVAPVDLVSQGIGSLIPFIATAGVGKAVGLSKAGVVVLQGVQGGVVGGGIVKGEIYSAVKEQLINSGVDEAKAEKAAQEAQAYNGKNLDQILLGIGLGVVASTTGADSAIRKLIAQKVGKKTAEEVSEQAVQEVLRTGFVRGAAKGAAVEFTTEGLQGGQERLAANIAVGREGFDVEPMRGVVAQGTLEGSIGAILGGGVVGISAKVEQMDVRQKVALRDAQKAADEAKQNNAPASAAAVEEQINQTIEETPDERVARLQREAQEGVGIDLEEEPPVSGLPPERIKSARWFESAARNRLKELQDKDDAGVEDFTTQERDEFEFLKASPTPEQIAERYGYGVAPAVEPTAVTTTPPTTPAATEPAPVEPEPTLTPPPAATEPVTLAPDLTDPSTVPVGPESVRVDQENAAATNAFLDSLEVGEYTMFDANGEPSYVLKITQSKSGRKRHELHDVDGYVTGEQKTYIGDRKAVVPELNFGRVVTPEGETKYVRSTLQKRVDGVPATPTPTTPTPVTPTPVTPEVPTEVEPPALAPLRRVVKAEQTEEDVSGLVGQGLVELYKGQPVLTQAGLEALPEAERPRLTPEARKIQIDTRTSEAAAEAISKNLRIGVDQVPVDVRMPAGWTLVGDVYIPPKPMERITEFKITPEYDIEETADVFAAVQKVVPPRPVDAEPETATNQEIQSIVDKYQTSEPIAELILANMNFEAKEAGTIPEGWVVERIDGQNLALSPVWQKSRRDIQVELRKLTILERGAVSARLTKEGWINEDQAKEYLRAAISRSSEDRVRSAEAEANERLDTIVERTFKANRASISDTVADVSKPTVDLEAEELARTQKPRISPWRVLDPNEIEFMSARQALKKLADSNVILGVASEAPSLRQDLDAQGNASWRTQGNVPKPRYVLLQEAASILAQTKLRALDAEKIQISGRPSGRAYRAWTGDVFVPRTQDGNTKYIDPWILVHEIAHTLTVDSFSKHLFQRGVTGADYYNRLKKALTDKSIPKEVRRAVKLYLDTIKALNLEKEYFKKGGLAGDGDRGIRNASARELKKIINPFTGQEITRGEMYALSDIYEFYAQAWNDEGFQDILKQIKVEPQKTVFQKFVDIIKDILGFESDSMAYAVIDASLRVASLEEISSDIKPQIERTKAFRAVKELPRTKLNWSSTYARKSEYISDGVKMARNRFTKLGYDQIKFTIRKDGQQSWSLIASVSEAYKPSKRGKTYLPSQDIFVIFFNNRATTEEFSERLASDVNGLISEKYLPLMKAFRQQKPAPSPQPPTAPAPEARESRRAIVTPQQDRDYLDAVERGDLDAAQRMVDGMAKRAGIEKRRLVKTLFSAKEAEQLEPKAIQSVRRMAEEYVSNMDESMPESERWENLSFRRKGMEFTTSGGDYYGIRIDWPEGTENLLDAVYQIVETHNGKKEILDFNLRPVENKIPSDPVTYDASGNVIPLSQRFQQGEADIRYNPLGYDITNVVEDIKAGRTDGPLRAVNNVVKEATALRDRVKAEADRRQRPRARGKASILERIARERSSGKLSEETAQALTDFVNSIREEAIGDTAISIKGAGGASNFDFGQSLVNFFLTQDQPKVGARVGIHEFWHGLSRFLPKTEAEKMAKDYTKALGSYLKENPWFLAFVGRYSLTPEQFEEYKLFNPKEAETKLVPVQDSQGNIVKYQIKYDADNYRYIMLDEWIAEKMTDLVESRQAMPNTFMGKLAKIIKEFLAQIQAKLGRDVYQSFYNLVTDPNQKIDLQRMSGVARPFQIYQPQDYNYAEDISDQIRYAMRQREDINREYTPNTDEERKAFEKATSNKVLARNPQLAVAAVRLKNGQITAGEYADLVDSIDPFVPKGADPIPTDDKIKQYIQSDKVGKVGFLDENGNPRLQDGSEYEFRIDINTYNRSTAAGDTVYNITAHESVPETSKRVGEAYAYVGVAKVTNPTFMTRAISGKGSAVEIAVGKGKFPLATVKGNYEPITELPADINDPNVWTEVGYNPVRSSFFVDTRSKQAVVGGSEAIMVGSRVFVKNAQLEARPTGITYGKAYNPLGLDPEPTPSFAIDTPEAKTLSNLKASMDKVDSASEAKGGKPETQKVSEIAANWMEQGGDERALQDAIIENTNLSPVNAAKVAKVIARQYDIQQQISQVPSAAVIPETITPTPEDRRRPKTTIQRVLDAITGVRIPPVKLLVNEKTALKDQIKLKAAAYRDAKGAQKETAASVVEAIKEMDIRGGIRPKQASALMKRAAMVNFASEKSVDNFITYAEKVVENANYDRDVADAKAAQKRAKEIAKRKNVAGPQKQVLEDIGKVEVKYLNDPREFAEAANYYMRAFKSPVSEGYLVVPDEEMNDYLSRKQEETQEGIKASDQGARERLAEKYGVPLDEVDAVMDAEDTQAALVQYAKREGMIGLINEKARDSIAALQIYNTAGMTVTQQELVAKILDLDVDGISLESRVQLIRNIDNILVNGQTNGVQKFVSAAEGQSNAFKASKNKTFTNQQRAWINILFGQTIGKKTRGVGAEDQKQIALGIQSIADTFRNIFGKKNLGLITQIMGFGDLLRGTKAFHTTMREITEETSKFFDGLTKRYSYKIISNNEGRTAEGVASYLIQQFPLKTEEESIATRRGVIAEDLNQKIRSGDSEATAEAELVSNILEKIDGNTTEEILANLKREFPANYEALMWYKNELLPKYKDFLKQFDENFNNQANNYNNPNYLPMGYAFAKAAELSPEAQRKIYNKTSLTQKQAANSIKRQDYDTLPKNQNGLPAAINYNLRTNVFNSLSDQLKKAYTSDGWTKVQAFVNSKDAIEVFGNEANREFMARRLELLQDSQDRRGYENDGFSRVLDGVAIFLRRLGIGIGLGGVGQVIKQAPDQIATTIANTGDVQLTMSNFYTMAFTTKERADAMKLMSGFSIAERGDAVVGGAEFSNPLESGFSNTEKFLRGGDWARIKDAARNISDVWLIALKKSDFWASSSGWLTYYQKKLEEEGGTFTNFAEEAELIKTDPMRQRAAYHAELMIDIYQGSSDPTRMARLSQRGKTGYENAWKGIFLAFNSFVLQQRTRMHSDLGDAMSKQVDPESKKLAKMGLSGTIAGILVFHMMRRYALPAISGMGAYAVYAMLGVDPEEPDEEKKKADAAFQLKRFYSEVAGNVLVGGFGSAVEQQTITALNQGAYILSRVINDEWIMDDEGEVMEFDKWKRDRAPFWYYESFKGGTDLGVFGIGFDQLANAQEALRKATDPELRDTLTTEEQRVLSLAAFSEILFLARLNDSDVARMFSRMGRETVAEAKERDAMIRRIQTGR